MRKSFLLPLLDLPLAVVHLLVRSRKHRINICITACREHIKSFGNNHSAGRDILIYLFFKEPYKFFPIGIIISLEKCHEFISTDTVYRAVLEYITDQMACIPDIFISGIMSLGIVDDLQIVEVEYDNTEFFYCSF